MDQNFDVFIFNQPSGNGLRMPSEGAAAAAEAGAPAFVVVTSVQLCLWSLTPALTMNSNTQQQQQLSQQEMKDIGRLIGEQL